MRAMSKALVPRRLAATPTRPRQPRRPRFAGQLGSCPELRALPLMHGATASVLDEDQRVSEDVSTASTGRRASESLPQPAFRVVKGIRPLGRRCHRPSLHTAPLGDEGVARRLVHDQGREL